MGDTYKEGLTIERVNNNGNYEKSNCIWTTMKIQCRNRRNTIMYKGKCLIEWCEILGVNYKKVHKRIYSLGWSFERALGIN